MGLTNLINKAANFIGATNFSVTMEDLVEKNDGQTTVFTNIRRIDGAYISGYAIDAALDDNAPVFLASDQGQILLVKCEAGESPETSMVPPLPGDYICIADFMGNREDVVTEHYRYIRDSRTISDDVFAYLYDEKNRVLACSVNPEAVKSFKELADYRKSHTSPLFARTKMAINRPWRFVGMWISHNVYLDGAKIGSLSNGGSDLFAISPGTHELKIKGCFGLAKSNGLTFSIQEGDTITVSSDYKSLFRMPYWYMLPNYFGIIPSLEVLSLKELE